MMAAPRAHRLPRNRRLKDRRQFLRARAEGRRVAKGCLIANWLALPPGSPSRIGVITGRKLGNAVLRNRARRLLREAFRMHQQDLREPVDLILIARASIVGRNFSEVDRDFQSLLRQAGLLS